MKWVRRLLFGAVILAVLAAALPFLVPLNFLAPRLEKLVSDKIHEPVSILSVRLALLPAPGMVIQGVTAGKLQDAHAESIRVTVDPFSLLKPVKVVNEITVESLSLNQEALGRLPDWFKPEEPAQAVVRRVTLENASLALKAVRLEGLDAVIELDDAGGFRHALIETQDKRMKLAIAPAEKNYRLDFEARDWKPPVGPALQFDGLRAQAVVNGDMLDLKEIAANLYGGILHGNARLAWRDGWRLQGRLHSKDMEVRRVVALVSPETSVSGRLDADGQFNMRAREAGRLFDAPTADVEFKLKGGVLYNFDLVGAVKSMSKSGTRGGQTHFDEFSGRLQVSGKAYRFRQLKIASGILAADGNLVIAPDKSLAGRMRVELKGTAAMVNVPLDVSGSLNDPLLRPTNAAIAGAVAGTAVLGPGLGTSLGVKAGEFVEKVFK